MTLPTIHMPIIAPPPATSDPQAYYDGMLSTTTWSAVPAPDQLHVDVSTTNTVTAMLYAMTAGNLAYIPPGLPLPILNQPAPPGGAFALTVLPRDVLAMTTALPSGLRAFETVLYLNIEAASVQPALLPAVQARSLAWLTSAWVKAHGAPVPDRATMEADAIAQLLLGQLRLPVLAGQPIGRAGLHDPADPASPRDVRLIFASTAGAPLAAVLHLARMPAYAGSRWTGHPLATSLASVQVPVSFDVAFEVWDLNAKAFVRIPQVSVDLFDEASGNVLETQVTDAQGRVHFGFPDAAALATLAGGTPDLYFAVRAPGKAFAGHTLPARWSTRGWRSVDGSPGFLEAFAGSQLGDAGNPAVFRVGLDVHLRLEYQDVAAVVKPAPRGTPLTIRSSAQGNADGAPHAMSRIVDGTPTDNATTRAGVLGELHGVIFDIEGSRQIAFHVDFALEDAAINLPRTEVDVPAWFTFENDPDTVLYVDHDETSIGTQAAPRVLRCTVPKRSKALFFLTALRHLQTFLFHLTKGDWSGVTGLTLYPSILPPATRSYAWPVGTVRMHPAQHWLHDVLVHEITHQVVWKQANYTTLGIALEARLLGNLSFFGSLALEHGPSLLVDNQQAFIEGWPELIEAIFNGAPHLLTAPHDEQNHIVPPPLPLNWGEEVEGRFANGMLQVFRDHVVTSAYPNAKLTIDPITDELVVAGTWLNDPAVQQRFLDIIWRPLAPLAPDWNPTTTKYLRQIELLNPAAWPAIKATLNSFDMAK